MITLYITLRNRLEKSANIFTYNVIIGTVLSVRTMRDNADRKQKVLSQKL